MKSQDLQSVRPGFDDAAMGSQAVFRCALQALSLPGRVVDLPAVAQLPSKGQSAAALLLLALLDSDTSLWLSPSLANTDAQAWLRFHTGCRCVSDPAQARFLWLAEGDAWPALEQLDAGSDEYPDQSATCVMELSAFHDERCDSPSDIPSITHGDTPVDAGCSALLLSGPGIAQELGLQVSGLPQNFAEQWAANHASFPRGVDAFFTNQHQVIGLPRSTRVHINVECC